MLVAGANGCPCCTVSQPCSLSVGEEGLVWELLLEVTLPKGDSPAGRSEEPGMPLNC